MVIKPVRASNTSPSMKKDKDASMIVWSLLLTQQELTLKTLLLVFVKKASIGCRRKEFAKYNAEGLTNSIWELKILCKMIDASAR